jgi:hypothetical protein
MSVVPLGGVEVVELFLEGEDELDDEGLFLVYPNDRIVDSPCQTLE